MPVALFVSPHLDDVAFSCGGTLARLGALGWSTCLCTVFTATIPNPSGFALRCQTDKGIGDDVDYMALRRAEDRAFAAKAGVASVVHLPLPEAPHRGYGSSQELFIGSKPADRIWRPVSYLLGSLCDRLRPDVIFAPQGLGNHVDHLQTIRAVLELSLTAEVHWYRDTPYAIRDPEAKPASLLNTDLPEVCTDVTDGIGAKVEGCCLYTSQIGFQFGGRPEVARKLRQFHRKEAALAGRRGFAERFLASRRAAPVGSNRIMVGEPA